MDFRVAFVDNRPEVEEVKRSKINGGGRGGGRAGCCCKCIRERRGKS